MPVHGVRSVACSVGPSTPFSFFLFDNESENDGSGADLNPQDDEITVLMQVPGKADTYLVSSPFLRS